MSILQLIGWLALVASAFGLGVYVGRTLALEGPDSALRGIWDRL